MRRNLLVTLLLLISIALSSNAQIIDDDLESYSLGAIGPQADHWTTWSGFEGNLIEDGLVTEEEAASGTKSMYINDSETVDVILLLGDKQFGKYELSWNMFVVEGKVGYYNIQEEEMPGEGWNLDIYFGSSGGNYTPGIANFTVDQVSLTTFEYPEGEWFNVKHVIDLDDNTLTYFINDENVYEMPYEGNLGGVDFFSIEAGTNEYYIDDVLYVNNSAPIDVTFQVDMSFEETVAEPVNLVGDFTDWDPVAMSDDDGDGIWSITVSLDGDNTYLYNFVNGETTADAESEIVDCGVDSDLGISRTLNLEGDTTVLDVVCYNECLNCTVANFVDVSFAVDMNFADISSGGVFVIVDDNDPIEMTDEEEDGVYEVTAPVLKNESHLYHFVNGSENETVPDECGTDGRRALELVNESVNLDIVCFSECTDCVSANAIDVTFRVDLQNEEEISASGVYLVGDFVGYDIEGGAAVPMTPFEDAVYEATVTVNKNSTYTYVYVNGGNVILSESLLDKECGTEEGGRSIETQAESIVLETVCYNACKMCITSGINDLLIDAKAFPNPTTGIVNIAHAFDQNSVLEVTVYNSIGQEVLTLKQRSTEILNLDLSELDNDVYFIEMTNGSQFSAQKIFKVD